MGCDLSLRRPSVPSRPICTASSDAMGRTVERAACSFARRLVRRSGPTIVSPVAMAIHAPKAGAAQGPHRLRNSRCGVRMMPVRPRERSTTVTTVSAGAALARNLASSAPVTRSVCRSTAAVAGPTSAPHGGSAHAHGGGSASRRRSSNVRPRPATSLCPTARRRPHGRRQRPDPSAAVDTERAVAVGFEPTEGVALTRFRGVLLRPLGHATAEETTGPAAAGRTPVAAWRIHRPALPR